MIQNHISERKAWGIVITVIILGFALRVYSAGTMPFITDNETDKLEFIKKISFNPETLSLPLGDRVIENPLLSAYLVKASVLLFGESPIGVRIIFVLLGTLSLLVFYKLLEKEINRPTALIALTFLAFSQYHIGTSRIAGGLCLINAFVILAMYVVMKILKSQQARDLYLLAFVIGLGCLSYQLMFMVPAAFVLYLYFNNQHEHWLKKKELYVSAAIVFLMFMPYLIWTFGDEFAKLKKEHFFDFGFSLRTLYLYFGEVFAWLTERTEFFIWGDPVKEGGSFKQISGQWHLFIDASNEFPFVHWVYSVLIFMGAVYCSFIKDKPELIRFSHLMFIFVFLSSSIAAGAYTVFDDHWWGGMSLFPGSILCAYMLSNICAKWQPMRVLLIGLIIYFIVNAATFVSLPEHQYAVPKDYLHNWYVKKGTVYLNEGSNELAAKRGAWVLKRSNNEQIRNRALALIEQAGYRHSF